MKTLQIWHDSYSQSGWQKAWRIIFVLDDVVAEVGGFQQVKTIPDTEERTDAFAEQGPCGRTGRLRDLIGQLLDEFLLGSFDVRLQVSKENKLL